MQPGIIKRNGLPPKAPRYTSRYPWVASKGVARPRQTAPRRPNHAAPLRVRGFHQAIRFSWTKSAQFSVRGRPPGGGLTPPADKLLQRAESFRDAKLYNMNLSAFSVPLGSAIMRRALVYRQAVFPLSFVYPLPAATRLDRQRSRGQLAGDGVARPTACARSAPVES